MRFLTFKVKREREKQLKDLKYQDLAIVKYGLREQRDSWAFGSIKWPPIRLQPFLKRPVTKYTCSRCGSFERTEKINK